MLKFIIVSLVFCSDRRDRSSMNYKDLSKD